MPIRKLCSKFHHRFLAIFGSIGTLKFFFGNSLTNQPIPINKHHINRPINDSFCLLNNRTEITRKRATALIRNIYVKLLHITSPSFN